MNEIDKIEEYNRKLTEYTNSLRVRADESKIEEFAKFRMFPVSEVVASGIFYVNEATEMLLPDYLDVVGELGVISETNHRPIFHNRWVIPIKDNKGLVQNLVGYTPDADERYVYGTAKYYRRRDTLYGLENINLAYEKGYAILTEGITDTIRIRSLGYKNCFARCGTQASEVMDKMLNRCEYGVIAIPDRDKPGQQAYSRWNLNRVCKLNTIVLYKDIDEQCRQLEDDEYIKEYLDYCIDWILQSKHHGFKCKKLEITMQ